MERTTGAGRQDSSWNNPMLSEPETVRGILIVLQKMLGSLYRFLRLGCRLRARARRSSCLLTKDINNEYTVSLSKRRRCKFSSRPNTKPLCNQFSSIGRLIETRHRMDTLDLLLLITLIAWKSSTEGEALPGWIESKELSRKVVAIRRTMSWALQSHCWAEPSIGESHGLVSSCHFPS